MWEGGKAERGSLLFSEAAFRRAVSLLAELCG